MKILHATSDWKWTGPAEPMVNLVEGLRALGHDVDVACPPAPEGAEGALPERCRERGIEPHPLFDRRRGYRPFRDRAEIARLREGMRRSGYDVVHVHHTRDHLLAWLALRPLPVRARLVVSWHHGRSLPRTPWDRLRLGPRGGDGIVVLSDAIAVSARRLGWPSERIAVVQGTVDTERFRPIAADPGLRRKLGLGEEGPVLGVVARIQPHRRFDLLLEALRRARRVAPGLRLLVVGRGTRAREVLEEPVRALGLEGAVVRAGYRRTDYRETVGLVDALVFLVPGSDGSCRAVLEAMAMEVPAIVSRRGILPEIVADGETGRVVDEDPDALAAAMLDVVRNPEAWAGYARASRRRVLAACTPEVQARTLDRLYREVAGSS